MTEAYWPIIVFLGPFLRGIMLANLKDARNFEAKIA